MIAQAAKTWNVLQFVKMVEHGTITFSNIYQRSYVWDKDRECKLFGIRQRKKEILESMICLMVNRG